MVLMQRRSRSVLGIAVLGVAVLGIALFDGWPKIRATMNEISAGGPLDSSGRRARRDAIVTNALLGVLATFVIARLAPWGDYELAGTIVTVLLGAAGGIVIGKVFRPATLILVDLALIAIYLIVAFTPIMTPLTANWVRVDPLPTGVLDAVVVLSGGVKSDTALNSSAADRLIGGLELMRAGRGRRLVTTRVVLRFGDRMVSSDSDQARLVALASIEAPWDIVDNVHTTRDEAVNTAKLLLPVSAQSIVLVTSPLHTRRACAAFEAVGFRVICRPSRERDYATNPPHGKLDRLAALRSYGYEVAGMVKYWAKGWLRAGDKKSS